MNLHVVQTVPLLLLRSGLASLMMVLILLRIGNGYTLWFLIWKFVPGSVAIRVPSHFLTFLTPLLSLILVYVMAASFARLRHAWLSSKALLAALIVAVAIEQYNIRPFFKVHWRSEVAFFASVPRPPAECRSFFVAVPRREPQGNPAEFDLYGHSVDAMLVAALLKIPTVNGIASMMPRDFSLDAPLKADYRERVVRYAQRFNITDGLCALDLKLLS